MDSTSSPAPATAPRLPKPTITARGVGLAAVFWILCIILYGFLIARGEDIPLAWAFGGQVIAKSILALYSVPVWWLTVREMDHAPWGWVLAAHGLIAPLYAWLGLESYILLFTTWSGIDLRSILGSQYQWILLSNVTLYAIQFAVYHLVRYVHRLRQKEKQATELWARAREQELAVLKAQINPHFLFNTLNSVSATLRRDPAQAREMIAKLAELMRYALDSSDRDLVPLRDEIDFTRQYLELERHRFSDRLDVQVDIDTEDEALETPVPPIILQPLVENALRHGIAPSESGGTVALRVEQDDRLLVRVEDTGVGPGDEDPLSASDDSTGLANTSARLQHTYGTDSALQTTKNTPSGFIVWFSLPTDGTAAA